MVSIIEERYGHRLAEHVDRLVHHATRGEVWERAALYARQAGDRAAALCLDAEAVTHYQQAIQSLGHLPAAAETGRLGIDLRLALRAPLWRSGQLERLREVFTEAEALATRLGETDRLDAVYSFFVQYHWAKGEPDEALAYGARCLEVADRRGDLGLRVTGLYYMASAQIAQGQFRRALERCQEIIERLEGPRATERFGLSGLPYSGACAHAAECWSDLGELDRALEAIERGERVAQAADHLYSKIPLAIARGRVGLQRDPEKAIPLLEATVATCREKRFAGQTMRALTVLGRAYGLVGRPQDGIPLLQEAIALQEAAGAFVDRARWTRVLAELYCRAGRLPEARATAEAALSFARRHGERANEAWTQWVLGQIGAAGQPAAAEAAVSAALALAQALGMRPLEAHCHLSLADLRAASGAAGEAEEHRQRAVEIYVETGARFWRERAVAGRRD
jgi:tetratricopeptide (TPR) repeat protein